MQFDILKQVLAAVIRYFLASLAAFLITKGIIDPALADAFLGQATAVLVGVVIIAATIGWKYLNAKYHILSLIKAVQTNPPADTPAEVRAAVNAVKAEVKDAHTVASY